MRKIDIFNHIWPEPSYDALRKYVGSHDGGASRSDAIPMMIDLEKRLKVMDSN